MAKRDDVPQGMETADAAAATAGATDAPAGLPKTDFAIGLAATPGASAARQPNGAPSAAKERSAATADSKPPSRRFALLTTAVASAAVLGSLIGTLATAGLSGVWGKGAPDRSVAHGKGLAESVAQLGSQVAALRASLEAANRTADAQLARMAERFDRAERVRGELAAKFAKIAESIERIEHRPTTASAPDTTGSIADSRAAPAANAKAPAKAAPLDGWIIRDVHRGHVLVESRYGAFDVVPGTPLPGLGRVEDVLRQDGRWIVVTPKGLITSMN